MAETQARQGAESAESADRASQGVPPAAATDDLRAQDQPTAAEPDAAASRDLEDRRLAAELTKRGVPPEEIQRLLALGREDAPASTAPRPRAAVPVVVPLVEEEPYEPRPTITLPESREATQQDRDEAGRLLTSANLARRRERYVEAEKLCVQALEKSPSDAVALELYGDVLQAVGRVDDALFCYDRARTIDPRRSTAERKFAELRLMQNRSLEALREEFIPRNPYISVILSAVFPGAGQLYNGQPAKGLAVVLAALVLVLLLGWTPLGFHHGLTQMPMGLVVLIALLAAVYVYALIDANWGATRSRKPKSGWDV